MKIARYIPGWPDRVGEWHGSVTCPACGDKWEACVDKVRYKTEFQSATCEKCGEVFEVRVPKTTP